MDAKRLKYICNSPLKKKSLCENLFVNAFCKHKRTLEKIKTHLVFLWSLLFMFIAIHKINGEEEKHLDTITK